VSVGLAVMPVPSAVGELHAHRLRITLQSLDQSGVAEDHSCWVGDVGELIERILRARSVLVERRDGAPPIRPRAAREAESEWLARVLTVVIGQLGDSTLTCHLVAAAIQRTAGVPVAIERRTEPAAQQQPGTAGPWPAWRGEIPLVRTVAGTWLLVCPTGSTGLGADYAPLLAALIRCLCEADADEIRAQDALRRQLANSVGARDASAFVRTAAALLGGSVSLRDRSGKAVATCARPEAGRETREVVLRDDAGLRGTLVVESDAGADTTLADTALADLALALLCLRDERQERGVLENRLAVLRCFVDSRIEDRGAAAGSHRLVLIRPVNAPRSLIVRAVLDRMLRAASASPRLAGLSLVPYADALLGAYDDDGADTEEHRLAWEQLLSGLDGAGCLRVVVSASTSNPGENKEQQAVIDHVSHLQRDGGSYFPLPAVALVDQLGPLTDVLRAVPGAQMVPYVRRVLGDLLTDNRFGGQLIDTLYAYLQTGGSPRDAGALLHLHGSSVKYRMRVLRELLGERLDDPSKRFDIELALRMYLAGRDLAARTVS